MAAIQTDNPEAEYWNNEGGRRWVSLIDRLERLAGTFSENLFEGVNAQAGESVLDIGCGGGPTSQSFAQAVGPAGRVVGADISDVILDVARQRYSTQQNLQFLTADAGTYPFPNEAYDVVASRFGVMFFPDPFAAFLNIQKSLKPTGRLCIVCWQGLQENPWMSVPAAAAFSILPRPEKPAPGSPGPFSLSDPDRVREILTAANFDNIRLEKVEREVNMGGVDEALDTLTNLGPAAASIREAESADRDAALAAMRKVLEQNQSSEGVLLKGAVWVIRANVRR